ncbi:MAG: hypothetical protein AB7I50_23315 [Vicinamibacterales bacterium]
MDYTTLVATRDTADSIKNWLNNSSAPATTILSDAQAWIYQKLRIREMLETGTGTLAANADTIALSTFTGYVGGKQFMFTGTKRAYPERKRIEVVRDNYGYDQDGNRTTGQPRLWATNATHILFDVKADQAYTYDFLYYKALTALSGGNLTNAITSSYPFMLRSVCLMFGFQWLRNQAEKNYWRLEAEKQIEEVNKASDLEGEGELIEVIPE